MIDYVRYVYFIFMDSGLMTIPQYEYVDHGTGE